MLVTIIGNFSWYMYFASKRDDLGQTPAVVYDSITQHKILHHMMILCSMVLEPIVFPASLRSILSPSAHIWDRTSSFGRRVGLGEYGRLL